MSRSTRLAEHRGWLDVTAIIRGVHVAWSAVVVCWIAIGTTTSAMADTRVEIRLRDKLTVAEDLVRIADIAEIVGGPAALRSRIGELDLARFSEIEETTTTITGTMVAIRLSLAGVDESEFTLLGKQRITIAYQPRSPVDVATDEAILDAMSALWRVPIAAIHLQHPESLETALARSNLAVPADDASIVASIGPSAVPGRIPVTMRISQDGLPSQTFKYFVDASIERSVFVVIEPIPLHGQVSTRNVESQRRELTGREALHSNEQVLEHYATRALQVGEFVRDSDVRETPPTRSVTGLPAKTGAGTAPSVATTKPIVVRQSTRVQVIARTKNLTVRLQNAELVSSGTVGDMVSVRNPNSKEVVAGRLVSPSLVEINF